MNRVSFGSRLDRKNVICILKRSTGSASPQLDQIIRIRFHSDLTEGVITLSIGNDRRFVFQQLHFDGIADLTGKPDKDRSSIGSEGNPIL